MAWLFAVAGGGAAERSPLPEELEPRLPAFIEAKERQARALAGAFNLEVSPDIWRAFELFKQGRWQQGSNHFAALMTRNGQYEGAKKDDTITSPAWQPLLEVDLVCHAFAFSEPKYARAFGDDIIAAIPRNSVYFGVEESFPLDWMYPHLSPRHLILKIEREPLAELSEEIVRADREYWKDYCGRLIGDWITNGTPIRAISQFADRVYGRGDFSDFQGDVKYARSDEAQKAFSKLRSSQAGVYHWRYRNTKDSREKQRMLKAANLAFRQALALCPYSPEAVFLFVNLLLEQNQNQDALLVAQTCEKLDPLNQQVKDLTRRLEEFKRNPTSGDATGGGKLDDLELEVGNNPTNLQAAFNLAAAFLRNEQTNRAIQTLEDVLRSPAVNPNAVLEVARAFAQMSNLPRLEAALEKLVIIAPESPEAGYDLAALRATLDKRPLAIDALREALKLSAARRAHDATGRDLAAEVRKDPRFKRLRQTPEVQELLAPK